MANFDHQINSLIVNLKKHSWMQESSELTKKYLFLKKAETQLFEELDSEKLSPEDQYLLTLSYSEAQKYLQDKVSDDKLNILVTQASEIIKDAQITDPTSQKQKIDSLNNYLSTQWPDLTSRVNSLFSIFNLVGYKGLSVFSFLAEDLLARAGENQVLAADYGRRSGTGNALTQYINLHLKVYGNLNTNYFNVDTLITRINWFSGDAPTQPIGMAAPSGYQGLKNFGNLISSELTSKFFTGSQPSSLKSIKVAANPNEEIWRDNQSSVWILPWSPLIDWGKEPNSVKSAADSINTSMSGKFNSILGSEPIQLANTSLNTDLAKIKEAISNSISILGESPIYSLESRSTYDTIEKLLTASTYLSQVSPEGKLGKLLSSIITTLGISKDLLTPDTFFQKISQTQAKILEIVNYLNQISLGPLDFTYSSEEASKAIKYYASTLDVLQRQLDVTAEGSDVYNRINNDIAQAKKLMEIVSGSAGNKFYKVFSLLKKNYNWMPKNPEEITAGAEAWSQAIAGSTSVRAFLNPDSFRKLAQIPMPSSVGPTKSKGPTAPAGVKSTKKITPKKETSTEFKLSNISDQEKDTVKLMQDILHSIGILLEETGEYSRVDTIKLKNSGETRNIAYGDGFWGPRTQASLETANRLFNLELITIRNENTVLSDADANARKLESLVNKLQSGKGTSIKSRTSFLTGEVADRLPQKIQWHLGPESASFDGKIPITFRNLDSLDSLYSFLTKSNIQQPTRVGATETEIGEEGFTFLEWNWMIINWFKRRAVFLFNTFRDNPDFSKYLDRPRNYYNAVLDLEKELANIYRLHISGLPEAQKANFLITPEILKESKQRELSTEPYVPELEQTKRKDRGVIPARHLREETTPAGRRIVPSEGLEGREIRRPKPSDESPPIGENIDLRREWFINLPYDNLTSPVLNLTQVLRIPAVTLAQTLMLPSDQFDPEAQYYSMVRSGIPENYIRWNNQRGEYEIYMVDLNNIGRWYGVTYLQTQSWFVQRYPVLAAKAKNPVDQFQSFLLNLRQELNRSVNEWVSSTEPTEDEALAVSEYLARWQKAINNKLRQLSDWRRA